MEWYKNETRSHNALFHSRYVWAFPLSLPYEILTTIIVISSRFLCYCPDSALVFVVYAVHGNSMSMIFKIRVQFANVKVHWIQLQMRFIHHSTIWYSLLRLHVNSIKFVCSFDACLDFICARNIFIRIRDICRTFVLIVTNSIAFTHCEDELLNFPPFAFCWM